MEGSVATSVSSVNLLFPRTGLRTAQGFTLQHDSGKLGQPSLFGDSVTLAFQNIAPRQNSLHERLHTELSGNGKQLFHMGLGLFDIAFLVAYEDRVRLVAKGLGCIRNHIRNCDIEVSSPDQQTCASELLGNTGNIIAAKRTRN